MIEIINKSIYKVKLNLYSLGKIFILANEREYMRICRHLANYRMHVYSGCKFAFERNFCKFDPHPLIFLIVHCESCRDAHFEPSSVMICFFFAEIRP